MFENVEKVEKLKTSFNARLGDFVVFVAIVLATIANFSDFGFSLVGVSRITAVSLLIYIVTSMTYNHCFNKGKMIGKQDDVYIAALKEYNEEVDNLLSFNLIGKIPRFIEYYIKTDLIEYRKGILFQFEIEYDEYKQKYLRMPTKQIMRENISLKMKKAIIKCNHARPIILRKYDIISSGAGKRRRPLGMSGEQRERIDKVYNGVYRLFVTIFAGTIGVDVVLNFTWLTLIQWAIRMMPILTALVIGKWKGYNNIVETESSYKKNQVMMIRTFKEWVSHDTEPKKEGIQEDVLLL